MHGLDIPVVVVDALVRLAPLLAVAARAARLLAWADDWYASWLVLAAWSLLCLAAPALFHYAVPLLLVFLLNDPRPPPSPLVTDAVVQTAITNLATVAAALPSLPRVALPPRALFRAAAILTLPWLVLVHLLHTRLLLALIGSLFIVHRAPWVSLLASVLWRSAFVRAALHAAHAFLTGQPLPKPLSFTTTTTTASDSSSNHTLRFLLTVHENQRWWVGLDWTAALIPSERPAWSSPALLPVSPPAAFVLPDPTTVYLPAPDPKSTIKRTATWKWVDPEWRLLVRTPGSSLSRISRPLPTDDPSSSSPSSPSLVSSASRLFKPTSLRIKASSSQPSLPQDDNDNDTNNDNGDSSHQPLTDPDGWVYSDNKWENPSHSNSLGKYTRYRQWTRIAIVSEHVQLTDHQPHPTDTPLSDTLQPDTSSTTSAIPQPDSPLRQRLRAALSSTSISARS